jgi:glycosyltransferase involved in cell wall biosynthesis
VTSAPPPGPPGDPRRIVLLLNNPFVTDSRAWKLATSLGARGWDVAVVARRSADLPDDEWHDGIRVLRVDPPPGPRWLPAPGLPWGGTAGGQGRLHRAVVAGPGRLAQALRYERRARGWAAEIARHVAPGPAVWQAEGLVTLPVALRLRAERGGRAVYDARDLHVESARFARLPGLWRRLLGARERAWAGAADLVLTANEPYADALAERFGRRPLVVFNGPRDEPGLASPAPRRWHEALRLDPATRVALAVGQALPGRGLPELVAAMRWVPAAALVVVGDGPLIPELEAVRAALPDPGCVHLRPALPPADLAAWTAAADVAVMPIQPTTLNHRLTTPTRLFDAMGAGVPVVASDLPGMAAIVRATGCGVMCDPADPRSIAAAIRCVLDAPPDERAAYAAAGLAAARGPYAWERQVDRLVAALGELARRPT